VLGSLRWLAQRWGLNLVQWSLVAKRIAAGGVGAKREASVCAIAVAKREAAVIAIVVAKRERFVVLVAKRERFVVLVAKREVVGSR
jgi:hypothetical protein